MSTQKPSFWNVFLLFLFPALIHSQGIQRLDNTTDQLSLLAFKSQITLDPFGVLDTWNLTTSFCDWSGVTCNIPAQRVTGLKLENLKLSGTISPYIGNLSFLQQLSLGNNSFNGILPRELGRLSQIRNLTITYNQIQGTIPSSLSLCARLNWLDLMDNKIQGSIPNKLGNLLELRVLRLSYNSLTGRIPPSLGNLSYLTNLISDENSIQGSIPEELGRLHRLLILQIGDSNLTGEIPLSVYNISSLTEFAFNSNELSGTLPSDMFSRLTRLTKFYAYENNLRGPIPSSLGNASELLVLDIGDNSFNGRIPLMSNMPKIQYMNLNFNQLGGDRRGDLDFISSLANSNDLQVLTASVNQLRGVLPSSIGNLSKELSYLYLSVNFLEGGIPTDVSKLVGLTILSLALNSLTGNIPPSIGEMPNLQRLILQSNKLSGNIPDSLGRDTELFDIKLDQNNLTGAIPASLGNLQRLQTLHLSDNMLSGTIPTEVLRLASSVIFLNLSSNLLSGTLPIDIGKLKTLKELDLSRNKLAGEMPESIGDCLSLTILNLSRNSFQGSIPNSIVDLKGIEYIDLSSNNLSGTIPSSFKSLKFLQVLNLSRNQLEGEVPKEGIFINSTSVFLNGNRNLCGGIPVLELPSCIVPEKHSARSNLKLIIGIVVGVAACGILSFLFLFLLWKRNKSKSNAKDDIVSFEGPHRLYTYHDLRIATDNFNARNLIGEGGFGRVYKGILSDGTPSAVKVFNMDQHWALKSFFSECEALRNVRHRNLVKIMTACSSSEFKALVLQFLSNGSLDQWLNRSLLEFDTRQKLEVAIDVASALEYLHHDCETAIVHCDLKPSNILLDENMTAHVGDFGIARILLNNPPEGALSSTIGLKGSIGYIAPEYGTGGEVSRKGDVYSYGILLLEMFTGKKPTDEMFTGELTLQKWVTTMVPDQIRDIVGVESVQDDDEELCLVSVLKIGLTCAANSPEDRPSMRDVSSMITNAKNKLSSS